jgi:hypothetical protein
MFNQQPVKEAPNHIFLGDFSFFKPFLFFHQTPLDFLAKTPII